MGHNLRKPVFGGLRTTKAQTGMASFSIATDKGHSSKDPALSVAVHKPTDEYFGGYRTVFFSSKFHFIKIKCQRNRIKLRSFC